MSGTETALKRLPSPPFVAVDGIANFRDVGGYPTRPSGSIRRGILFRSANPTRVTPSGSETLRTLGVRKIFDLRSEPEILKGSIVEDETAVSKDGAETSESPFCTTHGTTGGESVSERFRSSPAGNGHVGVEGRIERVWTPVFKAVDYTSTATFDRYRPWAELPISQAISHGYMDIFRAGGPAYRTILEHLASPDPTPCLIHCTAGKDRTGALVALVLLLCGVDKDTIAMEYALTKQGLGPILDEYKKRYMSAIDMPDKERIIDILLSADAESMLATIELLEKRFGGAEEYVRHVVGLDDDKIAVLRRNMITQQKAVL